MNGYTIEGSIDLLERDVKKLKDQGGGGGTTPTAQQVTYNPTGTSLVATNVQAAITELDLNVSANVEDIEDLQTDVTNLGLDKQDKLTAGTGINIVDNVISCKADNFVEEIVTFDSASINTGTPQVRFRKWGKIVVVDEIASWNDTAKNTANAWTKLCSIPDKFKPINAFNVMGYKDGTVNPIMYNFTLDRIQVNGWSSSGTNYYPHLHAVYLTTSDEY